jgi:hypothetical protein
LDTDAAIDLLLALNAAKSLNGLSLAEERRPAQAERRPTQSMGDDRERALAHLP